jgi:dihydroflavonol-4-reductase
VEAGTLARFRTSRALAIGTGVRILAAPAVLALLLGHDWTIAAIVFLLAAATDFIDGRLARRWMVTTKLGSFLDTTADKLLVATTLLGLLSVDRVSPWVAFVIIGREFVILGLRAAVASGGSSLETSRFGKWKATFQFAAITLAILRPDVVIAGVRLDQWLMGAVAVVTAWSGVDYLRDVTPRPRRVFVTGGTGLLGTALITALLERGDQVVALARSADAALALAQRGIEVVHGEVWDIAALTAGMEGCDLAFNLAGVNKFCVWDPAPMMRANVDGAIAAVRAAKQAGLPRLIHTSSAVTVGERRGVVADESTAHRGHYLSRYEESKTLGERAAKRVALELGQEVVFVNPSSVQGPGRAGGTGRLLIAFLNGRLKVFVDTVVSLVDIQDCVAGHLLAAQRGEPGERYLLNGIRMPAADLMGLAAEVAGVTRSVRLAPRGVATIGGAAAELYYRARGRNPPVCREFVRVLLHGHRFDGSRAERELGLVYTPARETLLRTVKWAYAAGLLAGL